MRLSRRTLYMLPTRFGLVYGAMLATVFIAAVNYGAALGFLLAFLFAAVALVSMLYTHRNLAGLEIAPGACGETFAGERAAFTMWIANVSATARQGIRVRVARAEIARVDVPARARVSVQIHAPTTRRGYLDAPTFTIASDYPLGLFRSWSRRAQLAQRCLVFPRPASAAARADAAPGASGRVSAEPHDFSALRAYRAGDSPQHIHWKAVARGQELVTKQFAGSAGAPRWLEWDGVAGDDETRLAALTRAVLDAHAAGAVFGLRLPAQTLAPAHGEAHRAQCLRALALH